MFEKWSLEWNFFLEKGKHKDFFLNGRLKLQEVGDEIPSNVQN
jgi:hypothetical protein